MGEGVKKKVWVNGFGGLGLKLILRPWTDGRMDGCFA